MAILSPWRGRVWARGDRPASVASVPNLICVARILATPVFVWLLVADQGENGPARIWAVVAFVILISTDFVDGRIARGRNLVTDLGKLLDPIADKTITGAAFIGLSVLGELPWWVTILVLVREVGITVHRLLIASDRVVPASFAGKAKTMAQAIALPIALLPLADWFGAFGHWVQLISMSIAVLLTVISGIEYVWHMARPRR